MSCTPRCSARLGLLEILTLVNPDFFRQAAMEPLDVAVAIRVMIRRAPMGDAQLPPSRSRSHVIALMFFSSTFPVIAGLSKNTASFLNREACWMKILIVSRLEQTLV